MPAANDLASDTAKDQPKRRPLPEPLEAHEEGQNQSAPGDTFLGVFQRLFEFGDRAKLSKNVMERVCRTGDGLFPSPAEIKMRCSCPDGVLMCKHIAATLYGAGAQLDAMPTSSSPCAALTAPN